MRSLLRFVVVSAVIALAGRAEADEADQCANEAEAGQVARAAGKLRAAREHVIACARPTCPRVVRSDCARWLNEIEAEVPSIVVRAREDGRDVAEVVVFVDGTKTAERVDGKPIPLDVGEHELRFEKAGVAPVSQRVVVRSGERSRLVSVVFGAEAAGAGRPSLVGPLVLGGVGLGLLGGGGALWAVGSGEHADLESTCAPAGACSSADIDASRTKLILGDVAVAVGVVALAGAAYWYLSSRGTGAQARLTAGFAF